MQGPVSTMLEADGNPVPNDLSAGTLTALVATWRQFRVVGRLHTYALGLRLVTCYLFPSVVACSCPTSHRR